MRNAYSRLLAVSACAVAAYFGGAAQVRAAYPEKPIHHHRTVPRRRRRGRGRPALRAADHREHRGEHRRGEPCRLGRHHRRRCDRSFEGGRIPVRDGQSGQYQYCPERYRSLSYDPAKDLQAVAMGVQMPILLVARPDAPFTTVAELISYSKQNPGKLTYGSGGTGTSLHLAGAMFARWLELTPCTCRIKARPRH